MLSYIRRVVAAKREDGASAVEYGLLVAAIAALVVIIVFALGQLVQDVFKDTCDSIKSGTSGQVTTSSNCSTS